MTLCDNGRVLRGGPWQVLREGKTGRSLVPGGEGRWGGALTISTARRGMGGKEVMKQK